MTSLCPSEVFGGHGWNAMLWNIPSLPSSVRILNYDRRQIESGPPVSSELG